MASRFVEYNLKYINSFYLQSENLDLLNYIFQKKTNL